VSKDHGATTGNAVAAAGVLKKFPMMQMTTITNWWLVGRVSTKEDSRGS
jgi:hypothetical protein